VIDNKEAPMLMTPLAFTAGFALAFAGGADPGQAVERQHVATITAQQIDGGVLSEITWDNGALLMQGAVANPDGSLSGRYLLVPATGTTLTQLKEPSDASTEYWTRKSKRTSPTGLGTITSHADAKMPMYGVGGLDERIGNAVDMGGIQHKLQLHLGRLVIHERDRDVEPYDGEVWSWSPAELNRIAYVDGNGDLWVATADGRNPTRLLKGHFTLPAWSDDGKAIAVAERLDGGRRWDVSVVLLPPELRTAR
jgi:hypothetical protein